MSTQSKLREHLEAAYTRMREWARTWSQQWEATTNRRNFLILTLIVITVGAGYSFMIAPPGNFPDNELITVPEGTSVQEIGQILQDKSVISSAVALQLTIRILGRETAVRAGDYLFKEPKTMFAIARAITTGEFGLEPEKIRIPEGATTAEIGRLLAGKLQRVNAERFAELAQPYEGYLFPDTYYFLPNATEETIIRAMRQNFDDKISSIMGDIVAFGRPLTEVVTMASILEREAHIFNDRRMIAGVLWRRIDKDMLLQVDATFLYSIGRSTFELTRADLQKEEDLYNTYVHKGLPPTPIGSPGLSSLKAAVTPIDQGYLFYLADRHGTTYYSKTYEEHLQKKRLYIGS